MKIKTITCHDVYNVGASLQAYALQQYIENHGHEVEIINYKPEYLTRHYRLNAVPNPRFDRPIIRELYILAKLPSRIRSLHSRKKREFDQFTKQFLKCTSQEYHSNEELKKSKIKADVFIAGSDQIWNPLFQNGKDPAFYLDFVTTGEIISYAASFSVNELPREERDEIKKRLRRFDYISIREQSGLTILEDMDLSGTVVCDPVFLLDRTDWIKLIGSNNKKEDPFIFVYDFDSSEFITRIVDELSDVKKIAVKSYFSTGNYIADESGPLRFLCNILNAETVISNSFHATAFSLLFHKNFYVVERKESINSRLYDLLGLVGLQDRLLSETNRDWKQIKPIDWNKVDIILEEEITNSKGYLLNILED